MSATPILSIYGSDLTPEDYGHLRERAISRELADDSGIRRVDSYTGREYRLRLDRPELEQRIDGTVKERAKYLQPAERRNILYFPPGMPPALLGDASKLLIISEGEFKALALWGVSNHQSPSPRFGIVSVPGVWNFCGTIGKTSGPDGERRDVKGIIPDVDRIEWKGRQVIIAFDSDIESNPKVRAAGWQLTAALKERGATVGPLEWPIDEGKGIDDRIAKLGPERVLQDIARVQFGNWHSRLIRNDNGKLLSCFENAAVFIENSPEWAGVLGYNEFTGGHYVLRTPPSPITSAADTEIQDHFDTEAVRWLERHEHGRYSKAAKEARRQLQAKLATLRAKTKGLPI